MPISVIERLDVFDAKIHSGFEYLTLARQYEDQETRAKYYDLFQEELQQDPPYAFICYIDANYVADSDIQGISENTVLGHHGVGIFWNIQDWEIVQE